MHNANKHYRFSRISNTSVLSATTASEPMKPATRTRQGNRYHSSGHYWIVCGNGNQSAGKTLSRADVISRGKEISVMAELPGDDKYIDIALTRISSKRNRENNGHYRCVITRGECSVSVSLPADVDTTRTKAEFRHGVLKLIIPKDEAAHDASILD